MANAKGAADRPKGGAPGVKQTAPNKLIKPKTKRGQRALEKREPKLVRGRRLHALRCTHAAGNGRHNSYATPMTLTAQIEDAKKLLMLYSGTTSQMVKDVMSDLHRLKAVGCWGGGVTCTRLPPRPRLAPACPPPTPTLGVPPLPPAAPHTM